MTLDRLFLAVSMMSLGIAISNEANGEENSSKLVIVANRDSSWGGEIADVEKVLYSSANTLWQYFPERELKPILVDPKGGPITLHRLGPNGEHLVRLNTGDRLWAQHAFQFSHEFCHILCRHRPGANRNLWFEESVCEAASLFALRRMAAKWETDPPYPNWKSYSRSLTSYADDRLKNSKLPDGQTLAEWYREHADFLAADPVNRDRNLIVAAVLLALLEKRPEQWAAINDLNQEEPGEAIPFDTYLNQWHQRSPAKFRRFVQEIANAFEVDID